MGYNMLPALGSNTGIVRRNGHINGLLMFVEDVQSNLV